MSFPTTLELSGKNARNPPLDISQLFITRSVVLKMASFQVPPSIFASLPQILRDPSLLKYNNGRSATIGDIESMIDLTYYIKPVDLQFFLPNGDILKLNAKAHERIIDVYNKIEEFLNIIPADVLFVRKFGNSVLRLPLCNLPIGLFHIPGSKWTLEFEWLPYKQKFNKCSVMMVSSFFEERNKDNKTERCASLVAKRMLERFTSIKKPTKADEDSFNDFLKENNNTSYCLFLNQKVYATDYCEFIIYRNGKVEIKTTNGKRAFHDISELIVDTRNGSFSVIFGDDSYIIREKYIPAISEMINYMFIPIYKSVKKHTFDFALPERTRTTIPRMFTDSRANHIKEEKLQEVIESQTILAEKFKSYC